METKPLSHGCMLTRVGKWHMGNTVSFSHGHSRQAVPGHHQSNRYSSLGQSAWFSRLGTTVPSNSVHCCNLKKKKNQQKGGPAVSPVLGSLAEEDGSGRTTEEYQLVALWQGKTICFQVYFILRCTLLIKWTSNPFEKPHGAQIHLANLSFPPGAYLD